MLLDPEKGKERFSELGEAEALRRLDEFGTWIVIWGSTGAVKTYHDLKTALFSLEGPRQDQIWEFFPLLHRLYANFVIEVRHDIGFAQSHDDIEPRHVLGLGRIAFYRSHLVEASKMPMWRLYRLYKRKYKWVPPWKAPIANDQRSRSPAGNDREDEELGRLLDALESLKEALTQAGHASAANADEPSPELGSSG